MQYGLAISVSYSSRREGGILLVPMISTCLRGALRKGRGVSTLWVFPALIKFPMCRSAICKCRSGYTGDPYSNCQFDPCSSSPCGPGAICENNGRAAICKCPPQHIGDPYVSCR